MADSGTVLMIFWLLVLIFLSFWVAGICFIPFTIVSILVPCVPDLRGLSDLLLKGVTFPYICSENMVNKKGLNFTQSMAVNKNCALWCTCLILFSFILSIICFSLYFLFQCIIPCCKCLEPLGNLLVKGISFPRYCAGRMFE